jgi:SRSO17 transposase
MSGGSYIVPIAFANPPRRQEEAHNPGQDGKQNPKHSKTIVASVTLQQPEWEEKQHASKYSKYHAAKDCEKHLLVVHPTVTSLDILKTNAGSLCTAINLTTAS